MRNVLAVTIALLFAAAILSPAAGFTFQAGQNQSYSIGSTPVGYSIKMGEPAQNLTLNQIPAATSPTPAVRVTATPYSFKIGSSSYSIKYAGNVSATPEGLITTPGVVALGSMRTS